MKRWSMWLLCAMLLISSAGCVEWHYNQHFHPEEHLNTRWVCQEIEGYFDVAEDKRGLWCRGEFTINGEQRPIEFNLEGVAISMSFVDDHSNHNLLSGAEDIYKDGILTITVGDDGQFDSALHYSGKKLTFIQTDISPTETTTTTTSTTTTMTKTVA